MGRSSDGVFVRMESLDFGHRLDGWAQHAAKEKPTRLGVSATVASTRRTRCHARRTTEAERPHRLVCGFGLRRIRAPTRSTAVRVSTEANTVGCAIESQHSTRTAVRPR